MWYNPATDLAATKLDPFHRDTTNTPWTADATRDWKGNLRYSYDDLEAPRPRRASAMFHSFTAGVLRRPRTDAHDNLLFLRRRINEKYGTVRKEIRNSPHIQGKENDYTINVIYDR
jgi:hypothetical protein